MTDLKTCPTCGQKFDPADRLSPNAVQPEWSIEQMRYCSETCARRAENRRAYRRRKAAKNGEPANP